jgi:hypothetical protein
MDYIDPHIHMVSRTTDDYETLARMGCVAMSEPAFWAGFDRGSVESFRDYFRQLTEFEPKRAAQFGIKHYTWLCINAKEAENVSLSREVIAMIPEVLEASNVLGIGEIGLNMMALEYGDHILVIDSVTPRFLLISQVLFFLPYSLLIWGWVYWRLDSFARASNRPLFHLDCEGVAPPRPIDYFVASFSSVFSATINAIKGNSARARILILFHGFMIYDVMGITLSRAVALIQSK